jgi:hypothetical protein
MILVSSILSITGTPSNGSLPIGNGQGFTVNTLTAGANVTITNGPGTITIAATGGSGTPAGSTNEIQYNNAGAFGANSNLAWDIANSRAIIGTEVVASPNSRCVIIGKGGGTNQTFAVHNNTGTSNSFLVRDDGTVLIGGATPFDTANKLYINENGTVGSIFRIANLANTQPIFQVNRNVSNGAAVIISRGTAANQNLELQHDTFGGVVRSAASNGYLYLESVSSDVYIAAGTNFIFRQGVSERVRFVGSTGNVLIGTPTDVATSILTLNSTTKGFLPPRMTTAQRDLIATPATGLTIFNTDNNTINQRTSSAWVDLVSSSNYDGLNIAFGTTNGTKIGTATNEKLSFWNATPIAQPTTAVTAATLVSGGGTNIKEDCTFDGYTIGQVVKALRNAGLLS